MTDTKNLTADKRSKPTAALPSESGAQRLAGLLVRYFMVIILIGLVIGTRAVYPAFFDVGNLQNVLSQIAPTGLVAVGMTFVIISSSFDLSVGAIFAVGATLYADFWLHVPGPIAFFGGLLAGVVCGLLNGLLVTKVRVNAFVATLGTASVFSGFAYLYSHSTPIVVSAPSFLKLGTNVWLGLPISVWILIIVVVAGGLVLALSTFGRSVYAVGGNVEAARLAGLRVDTIKIVCFVIVGLLSALGGMILASQTGTGEGDYGSTIPLNAIAIVIIGGTSVLGGEGAMWRTVIGILIFATLNNLFNALALNTADQLLVQGIVIVLAVSIDSRARRLLLRTST